MFSQSQQYFSQAVILIFSHDESGSAGIILNKPTQYTVGQVLGAEELCPHFKDNMLYLGGDVGNEMIHVLHPHGDLQDAQEIVNGVYMGGFESAIRAIKAGNKSSQDFRWFARYAGWGAGQLQAEVRAGAWFTAAAGKAVILNEQNLTGRHMWHQVLEQMGGDYAVLSQEVRRSYPAAFPDSSADAGADTGLPDSS
jgi:putative transcriptional regulator